MRSETNHTSRPGPQPTKRNSLRAKLEVGGGAGLAFATSFAAVVLVVVNMLCIQNVLKARGNLPSDSGLAKQIAGENESNTI